MMHHGLKAQFKEIEAFYSWMKLVMGLPLLPEKEIEDAWKELKKRTVTGVPTRPFQVKIVIIIQIYLFFLKLFFRN